MFGTDTERGGSVGQDGVVRIVITTALLAVSAAVTAFSVAAFPMYNDRVDRILPLVPLTGLLWLLFALAFVALRTVPARASVVLVIVGSLAIGGAAMAGPPNTSTDSARYAWDGIVQNAGISPYAYVPGDPALERLRTDWLFTDAVIDEQGDPTCPGPRMMPISGSDEPVCTAINRAHVPTIYPPTSEIFFAGLRLLTGPDAQYWPMQLAGLIMSLGITGILLRALTRRDLDPRWAALWGWSPLAATEAVTNSHIDVLGALLALVATLLVANGRRWAGALALGASIGTKLIPVIAAPALLRRQPWKIIVGSAAIFIALYIPYILTTGIAVLGYLPGYLSEEGYSTGSRFIMLSLIAPGPAATVLAAVLIVVTGVLVWWKTPADNLWLGQVMMIGVTLLVVTPRYPWYALMLVPFVAMSGRWEWMAVPFALTERLLIGDVALARVTVAAAIVLIVVVSARRAGPGAPGRLWRWLRHPFHSNAAPSPI